MRWLAELWRRWQRTRQIARINRTFRHDYLHDTPAFPCFGGPLDGRRITYGIAEDLFLKRKKRGGSYQFNFVLGRWEWRLLATTKGAV